MGALFFSASIGVVGMPVVEAIARAMRPQLDGTTIAAVLWLAVLTLPLSGYLAVLVWAFGRGHPVVVLGLATIAALLGGWFPAESLAPARAPEFFGWLLVFVADARGSVMALCSVVAGSASGFLLRDPGAR